MSHRMITVFGSILVIVVAFFLIVLSYYSGTSSWQFPLLLGIGSALLPAGIFAILGDVSFSRLLLDKIVPKVDVIANKQIETVDRKVGDLTEKLDISLRTLSTSTQYLSQSNALGIVMAYPDRRIALEHFLPYLTAYVSNQSLPNRSLVLVASSIKGVIDKFPEIGKMFTQVLETAREKKCDVKILLTHPAYSRYREIQESRQRYDIAKEILHAINWIEAKGIPSENIKVYKGTPTTFMLATKERMLLNFYPYQTEAFNCFCLEVQDTGEDVCIYRSFYDNHFHKPWTGEPRERDHYLQTNSLSYIHKYIDWTCQRSYQNNQRYGRTLWGLFCH